ncbi:MAG: tRNA pseudouridine(55) synthase TruB [Acidobacteria bacterium]|nr:tRNA pseudouridine(55) synthase TruB [Acidobacteriota bacterium]MBV9622816.1 tRNA pseudouridine(55) synthase TruB [Acidobacteriota bacterium]
MNGVLIIDKPCGMTSHDVVSCVRRILKQPAVGHLGTLDPMATGVLALVLGTMTRLAQFYLTAEKVYEGVIRFGFATDTYDIDGERVGEARALLLTLDELRNLGSRFLGTIEQIPPPFSAKKIHGVPAYKLARKKKEVVLKPVQVEVKDFEIAKLEDSRAFFRSRVASGTYMRSVAHDMGQLAGCGAHLESLRRTRLAEFEVEDAHDLDELEEAARCGQVLDLLVHPRKLLPLLPAVTANEEIASRIRHGRPVNLPELSRAREVKVFYGQRDLIAISTRVAGTLFRPRIVLG